MKKTLLIFLLIMLVLPVFCQNMVIDPSKVPVMKIDPNLSFREQMIAWGSGWLIFIVSAIGTFISKWFYAFTGDIVEKQQQGIIKKACSAARHHIGEVLTVALAQKLPYIIKKVMADGQWSLDEFKLEIKEAIIEAKNQLKPKYMKVLTAEFTDLDAQFRKWATSFLSTWVLRFLESKFGKQEGLLTTVNG